MFLMWRRRIDTIPAGRVYIFLCKLKSLPDPTTLK